jgi:hypothetical protein
VRFSNCQRHPIDSTSWRMPLKCEKNPFLTIAKCEVKLLEHQYPQIFCLKRPARVIENDLIDRNRHCDLIFIFIKT